MSILTLLLLTVLGFTLLFTGHSVFLSIYRTQLALTPSSGTFPVWKKLPPLTTKVYLFHVLNPDQVSAGSKPKLEQRGPYAFLERHFKTDIVWNENGTITYKQIRTWEFAPELSTGSLQDSITIINPIGAGLGPMIENNVIKAFRWGLNVLLKGIKERLFITKTVEEILFSGFHDPVFDRLEEILKVIPQIKKMLPPGSVMDKFAFFYDRNGTDYVDGVWNMFTGVNNDGARMGQVHSWNYSTQTVYPGRCGHIRGGAGEFFPPSETKTSVSVFSNDLCRTLDFQYSREMSVNGIKSYEYVVDHSLFANSTDNPSNKCFEDGNELPSGVFNSSLCRFGAPVFISQPHFFQADPSYLVEIEEGMRPTEAKHGSYIRLEPVAGVPTDVGIRFQVNMYLAPVKGISMLEGVREMMFPVMWQESEAGVPSDMAFKMILLANLENIMSGLGLIFIGIVVSTLIIYVIITVTRKRQERGPILPSMIQEDSATDQNILLSDDPEY